MQTTHCTLTALLLCALLYQPAKATEVYKWTDADGGVHYGQQKPADVAAEHVTLEPDGETDAAAKAKLDNLVNEAGLGSATTTTGEAQQPDAQQPEASGAADAKTLKADCARATETLSRLQNRAKRLLVTDEGGTPSVVDSVDREAEIERLKAWLSANKCPLV